jgi:gamma-glutamyltranspeptidase/glutathione hydrolase
MQSARSFTVVAFFGVWLAALIALAAYPRPLTAPRGRGMVAADHPDSSRAGAQVLAKGGNAVDAAVATALAAGVVSPAGSGLGGGGFLLYWSAKDRRAHVLDFRESAPKAAKADMFVVDGKADPKRSKIGGAAVAIPGEPAGLAYAVAKWGKLGLAADAEPAIKLAKEGFRASRALVTTAREKFVVLPPATDPMRALIAPIGSLIAEGDRMDNPALASTLAKFAKSGREGFYKGAVAAELLAAVKKSGGALTADDLASYAPLEREPLEGHFRGKRVIGVPPPAGGATVIETLQILDARPPLAGAGSSASLHALVEAFKHAFADRARALGDPGFVDVPTRRLVDPSYAKELAARIDDKVQKPERYGDKSLAVQPPDMPHDLGTSHLCVVDGEGNVAALTTTINLGFGSRVMAAGVILNDEMDDFSARPGVPNAYGLIGAFANAIAPRKRPLSSMSPTLVLDGDSPLICAGGSGGPMIVSETVQTIVNVIDFGMDAEAAVSSPRIHAQWVPDELVVEPEIPADVVEGLKKRGHHVVPPPFPGAAQIIVIRDDRLEGASDPRKGGSPAAP